MEGQLSIFDIPIYFYCAPNGKWDKKCASCKKWDFSFKGVRCTYPDCKDNGYKDFESMLNKK